MASNGLLPVLLLAPLTVLLLSAAVLAQARRAAPPSAADAVAWYLELAIALGSTLALCGLVVLVKVVIAFVHPGSAYAGAPDVSGSDDPVARMREADLILGFVLLGAGLLLASLHMRWRGNASTGDRRPWLSWLPALLTTGYYGVWGISAAVVTADGVITNLLLDPSSHSEIPAAFGDALGITLVLGGAWLYLARQLAALVRSRPATG